VAVIVLLCSSPMEEERDQEVVRDVFGDSDEDEPAPYGARHEIDEDSHVRY